MSAITRWRRMVEAYIDSHPYLREPKILSLLDKHVKALGADQNNNHRPLEWFLREGHKNALEEKTE